MVVGHQCDRDGGRQTSVRWHDVNEDHEAVRVRKQTNKQTNVTHIHGPVAAVNAHTLKASGSVTQLESQLL